VRRVVPIGLATVICAALAGCAGAVPVAAPTASEGAGSTLVVVETAVPAAADSSLEGAKALAQQEIDRSRAGDVAGAWRLLDSTSQTEVSRADYVTVHEACPLRAPTYVIKSARLESETKAVVTIMYRGMSQAYDVVYEEDQWRWQLPASDAANYKDGAADTIVKMRKIGVCEQARYSCSLIYGCN
jgi:hypothetical protein